MFGYEIHHVVEARKFAKSRECTHEMEFKLVDRNPPFEILHQITHFGKFIDDKFFEVCYFNHTFDIFRIFSDLPNGGREWHPDILEKTGTVSEIKT